MIKLRGYLIRRFSVHMDDPDVAAITELRKEGYITRTRINTETEVDADGSRNRLETFFAEEDNHTQAPRWASNHDHFT